MTPFSMPNASLFRKTSPSTDELAAFDQDGYIAYPDIFTDEARTGLIKEIQAYKPVADFLALDDHGRSKKGNPYAYFERPWNDRKTWSDQFIDDPFITTLLQSTIGPEYHFCHSALNIALPGSKAIGFHQDHHHWFHENPVNLAEREKYYIQILYYPNGFKKGDRSLSIIPGSHRVSPAKEVTAEKLLAGDFDEQAGRALRSEQLDLAPGSLVYINARMFHAVEPKPMDSLQPYRIFFIDIFKEAGPPHRYTQDIPQEWMERATPARRTLFERDPYTETCWTKDLG
jgi:hypothetical protein